MNTNYRKTMEANETELQRVIEPLASYLCATDQPRIALKLAVATLCREIEQINLAANAQVVDFQETRYVVPV